MEFNGFTDKANDALNCALTCAMSMGHTYVGEHILYGLCGSNGGVAYTVLRQSGVTCNSIASRINALIGKGLPTQLAVSDFTPRSRRILKRRDDSKKCRQNHRRNRSYTSCHNA